jgi:2'-5' RNA ligase
VNADPLRLFFALWPSPSVRNALYAATCEIVEASGGRAVPVANYHLTLAFLGLQPRTQLAAIGDTAARLAPPTGTLHLTRLGCFRAAHVLWAGPQHTPSALSQAVNQLRAALGANGVSVAPGPFRAHVTLARRIERVPPQLEISPIRWDCAGVVLVARERTRPRYRVVATWPDWAPVE